VARVGEDAEAGGEGGDRYDEEHQWRTLDPEVHPPRKATLWRAVHGLAPDDTEEAVCHASDAEYERAAPEAVDPVVNLMFSPGITELNRCRCHRAGELSANWSFNRVSYKDNGE